MDDYTTRCAGNVCTVMTSSREWYKHSTRTCSRLNTRFTPAFRWLSHCPVSGGHDSDSHDRVGRKVGLRLGQ